MLRFKEKGTSFPSVDQVLRERDEILDESRMHLLKAQHRMKQLADLHRTEVEFHIGDLVFLKLRPYRQKSLVLRQNQKLSPIFYGPYRVLRKIGQVAYELELPPNSRIHPVFHVSQLRRAIGSSLSSPMIPSQLTAEMELVAEP